MTKKIKTGKYGLPLKVEYCSHCTRSNQRPSNLGEFLQTSQDKKKYVLLDKKKICNACKFYFEKQTIDWKLREKELQELCNKFRKNNGEYDVLVPGSGGKDSIYVSHILKHKYKMNPISITWAPTMYTNLGKKNFLSWLNTGVSNLTIYQDQKIHRLLTKLAFLKLCHPFQPFILGQKNVAPKYAAKLNIKLVMFGEHDAEFGMMMDKKNKPEVDASFFCSDVRKDDLFLSGYKVKDLKKRYKLSYNDLEPYLPLKSKIYEQNKTQFHFFSYYKKWNFHDNYYYVVKNSNFKPSDERLEGSYDRYASMDDKIDWFHFYTFYTKFGMGRATAATDQEIRSGVITRDEGIALVKRFDGEFPKKYFQDVLNYMGIDKDMFNHTIDSSRPNHLWEKKYGKWKLKYPIWKV